MVAKNKKRSASTRNDNSPPPRTRARTKREHNCRIDSDSDEEPANDGVLDPEGTPWPNLPPLVFMQQTYLRVLVESSNRHFQLQREANLIALGETRELPMTCDPPPFPALGRLMTITVAPAPHSSHSDNPGQPQQYAQGQCDQLQQWHAQFYPQQQQQQQNGSPNQQLPSTQSHPLQPAYAHESFPDRPLGAQSGQCSPATQQEPLVDPALQLPSGSAPENNAGTGTG